MRKSSTERTREYRQRGIEARQQLEQAAVAMAKAKADREALRAEVTRLEGERDAALAGHGISQCPEHGVALVCPECAARLTESQGGF